MTKREAAIVMAHTGIAIGDFSEFQEYIENIMGRPVWTHELGSHEVMNKIRELSKPDFLNIEVR